MKQERGAYARNIEKLKQYVVDKNQKRVADSSTTASEHKLIRNRQRTGNRN